MIALRWRPRWIAALALASALLAACSTLQLSEPYDARIEEGVNSYHRSFVIFAKGLEFAGRSEAGRYDSPASQEFYASAAAELGNTILRARANNPDGTCPSAEAAALGLDGILSAVGDAVPGAQEDAAAEAPALTDGSCTVVTLMVLKAVHDRFEGVHKTQGFVSAGFTKAQGRNIEAAAEIAITAEQSKRP
jgi:hypothetical protein